MGAPENNGGSYGGLAITLFARACASIALSAFLLTHRSGWAEVFRVGAWYALVDGILAMAATALLAGPLRRRSSPTLIAITFADAVLRIGVGFVVLWVPAIAEVPMSIVPLFGAVGASASVLGAMAVILWTVEHHRHRHRHVHGAQALFDPIPIIGVLSIAVGSMLVFDPPSAAAELRQLLAAGGVVLGVSLLVSAIGAAMSRSVSPAASSSGAPR